MRTEEKEISTEKLKKWCMALGIFLVLMWICTIVSKSIYVSGLPRVTVQTPDKKYVEHIVDTEGIVVAGGEFAVNTTPGIRVSSLKVQEGDFVQEDDLLFCVDLEDLDSMISEKERQLKKLKYQMADLLANQTLASQKKEKDIAWVKEDYDKTDRETKETVERMEKALEDAEDALEEYLETDALNQTVSGSDANLQQNKEALENAVYEGRQNLEKANRDRDEALRQKQRELDGANTPGMADSAAAVYQLDMEALQAELKEFYDLRKVDGEVRADREGFVSQIQIVTDGRTSSTAAMLLTDGQIPCHFKFSITKEQGKYLHLGDKVKLKIEGNSNIEAKVDYLTENMAGGYDMICRLPEKVGQPGSSGSMKRTVQGELHYTVIPIEALHKEDQAYYIYVLKEKSGILGNELYAEKLKVRVADQNDRYAALEDGVVAADVKIITYSSEELKQGESVRMTE